MLLLLRLRNRGTDDTLVLRLDDNGCSVGDCGSLMTWLLLLLLLSTGGASGEGGDDHCARTSWDWVLLG